MFSHKRTLGELLRLDDDDSGYIEGKVFMVWPPRKRVYRIQLEVAEDSTLHRFLVEIPDRDEVVFRSQEHILLALKGVKVVMQKESIGLFSFPVLLWFPEGVALKQADQHSGRPVYCLYLNEPFGNISDIGSASEWWEPGTIQTVTESAASDACMISHNPHVKMVRFELPESSLSGSKSQGTKADPPPLDLILTQCHAATAPCTQQPQPIITQQPNHSSRRRRKRPRLHKELVGSDMGRPCSVDAATHTQQVQKPTHISMADTDHKVHQTGWITARHALVESSSSVCGNNNSHNTTKGDDFTRLSDLKKCDSRINVAGLVTFVNPTKKTRTDDWHRSFNIVDPSTTDSPRKSITVNCFQKKYVEWLPQVQKGDVVILRNIKAQVNGSVALTGYSDALRWAVYDPIMWSIRSPDKGSAPEKEAVTRGGTIGSEFSPYWNLLQDSAELEYCEKLGGWCNSMKESEGSGHRSVPRRRHLLLSEASPDLPPGGFFDCTIEVLRKINNGSDASTVYVTDYTANHLVYPLKATWCPPELYGRVLQCEMWDSARLVAKMMNPGEYWYLHNVRARWNSAHYMEGTMQLAEKIVRLDETVLEDQPNLRALLARKDELGLGAASPTPHIFTEMLLRNVMETTNSLTCVVELLCDDLRDGLGRRIYVTDYTYNPGLPATALEANWARNLNHRILKINLDDAQAKLLPEYKPGAVLIIQNLTVKHLNAPPCLYGYLGGQDVLVRPLHDPSHQRVQTLLRNKANWFNEITRDPESPKSLCNASDGDLHAPLGESLSPLVALQGLPVHSRPGIFRVLARAVDFFPFTLEDACILQCTKCEPSHASLVDQCPKCGDRLDVHGQWVYRLFTQLQDDQGGQLIASLSGKECKLLQGICPTNFRQDREAFNAFLSKLDPVLGNLREVHDAWERNEEKAVDSPLLLFTIEHWDIGEDKAYSVLDCTAT
ncbi:hypothetical protein J3R83DRAFT_7655 [Lanmaoa asiatica]|nr:hypothetical protein J3R83DRAFT_7655 [Lanmaoa asiatica]